MCVRRGFVALLVLLLAASVLVVVPRVDRAAAQSPSVLVSNLGQADHIFTSLNSFDVAQAFSTGGATDGYILSSVGVEFASLSDSSIFSSSKLTATIRADSSGTPGEVVGTLVNPAFSATSSDRVYSFSAPAGGIALEASTTYWLMLDRTGTASGSNGVRRTESGSEDAGRASGFSIANGRRLKGRHENGWSTGVQDGPYKIAVRGRAVTTTTVGSRLMVTHGEVVNADGRVEVWEGGGEFTVTVTLDNLGSSGVKWLDIRGPSAAFDPATLQPGERPPVHKLGIVKVGDMTYSSPRYQATMRITQAVNQAGLEVTFRAVDDSTQISDVPVQVRFKALRTGETILPVLVKRAPRVSSVGLVSVGGRDVCATPRTAGCFDHSRYAGGDTLNLSEGVVPDTSVAEASTSYTLRLGERPAPGATVRVTPSQAEMGNGGALEFFPSVVAWGRDDWQEERSIHVMSVHDADVYNGVFRIEHDFNEHFSGDTAAGGLVIHGTVADDDKVALVIKNSSGEVVVPNDAAADLVLDRGAQTRYTVELSHPPPNEVTAWVRAFDSDETRKSPVGVSASGGFTEDIWVRLPVDAVNARQTGFRFDSSNWDSPRTVYVKRWWYTEDYQCINGHDGSGGYCWEIEHHLSSGTAGFVDSTAQTLRVSMPDTTTNVVSPDLVDHVRRHVTGPEGSVVWRRVRRAIGDGFASYAPMTSAEAEAVMKSQTAPIERRINEGGPRAQLEARIGVITQKWWPIVAALQELERTGLIPEYVPPTPVTPSDQQTDTDPVVPDTDTPQTDTDPVDPQTGTDPVVPQTDTDPVVPDTDTPQTGTDPPPQTGTDPVVPQTGTDPPRQTGTDPVVPGTDTPQTGTDPVVCPSDDAPAYLDVPVSSFAYDDSRCLRELGISDAGDTYRPSDDMTRSEMAAFMANAYEALTGMQAPIVTDHGLTDIDGDPNADDIARIYGLGITKGTSLGIYSPDDHVIRSHMALFLTRLHKAVTGSEAPAGDTPFTDIGDLSAQEQAAIGQIYALKITTGTSQTTFDPTARVTREQMASFVARIYHALASTQQN